MRKRYPRKQFNKSENITVQYYYDYLLDEVKEMSDRWEADEEIDALKKRIIINATKFAGGGPGTETASAQPDLHRDLTVKNLTIEGTSGKSFERTTVKLDLFKYLFSPKIRREAFDPAMEDLKADYLIATRKYQSSGAQDWLKFCWFVRKLGLVLECLRVASCSSLAKFLPKAIQAAWHFLFSKLG